MRMLPLRLQPGDDLRRALEAAVAAQDCEAAFVLSGIGSLRRCRLRLAGADAPVELTGDVEILTLAGSVGRDGSHPHSHPHSHLHASIADAQGRVLGGHAAYGCELRTTAEVLLALLPAHRFLREHDPATGFDELVVRTRDDAAR